MSSLDDFKDITRRDESLAPLTWLKVGGPAEYLVEPRNADELTAVVRCCHEQQIPVTLLGSGANILIRDEGVRGVVIKLGAEGFSEIQVDGTCATAGGGALLSTLITQTVNAGLAGLETLVGIPGTVGGALHGNAGGRSGEIGDHVRSVDVLTATGERFERTEDELTFAYRSSSINELVILNATFQLQQDDSEEITGRMRKIWIMKKATQPLTFQSAGCIFKNPRGQSAAALIERVGLKGKQIGEAEISDRHANFIVTKSGATARDVLDLIDLARSEVAQKLGVELEQEIEVW